jgi:hypothetical protein
MLKAWDLIFLGHYEDEIRIQVDELTKHFIKHIFVIQSQQIAHNHTQSNKSAQFSLEKIHQSAHKKGEKATDTRITDSRAPTITLTI